MQTTMEFTTATPINIDRIKGQNRRLYEYLAAGGKIHCFHQAMRDLRIGYLNSRCSDLINKCQVAIQKRRIKVQDMEGNEVDVIEYSM